MDVLSVPEYVIQKGRPYGKRPGNKEYQTANQLKKRCKKKSFWLKGHFGSRRHCFRVFVCLIWSVSLLHLVKPECNAPQGMECNAGARGLVDPDHLPRSGPEHDSRRHALARKFTSTFNVRSRFDTFPWTQMHSSQTPDPVLRSWKPQCRQWENPTQRTQVFWKH